MMNKTDLERIAVLETKIDAVLENQLRQSNKLDELLPTFATKIELEEVKKKHVYQVWLVGTLSALLGMILLKMAEQMITGIFN